VVKKFRGKQYMLWKFKMETSLKARELWWIIDSTEMKPKRNMATLLAYTKKENRALNLFVQSMLNNQLMADYKRDLEYTRQPSCWQGIHKQDFPNT
jgi:hypothetical protein